MPNKISISYNAGTSLPTGAAEIKTRPIKSDTVLELLLNNYLSWVPDHDVIFFCTTMAMSDGMIFRCGVIQEELGMIGSIVLDQERIKFDMAKDQETLQAFKDLNGMENDGLFAGGMVSHTDPDCFVKFGKEMDRMLGVLL